MKISIILPTFNERDNIIDLIIKIQKNLDNDQWDYEILVVDDNSPDGTASAVQDYRDKHGSEILCLVRKEERGLASAIKYGIQTAQGDIVVVMDTDFNHDPKMIPQMIKFLEYYDLVIGSRFVVGGGMEERQRYYYSLLYNLFVRSILRLQVQDNLSGFFATRKEMIMCLNVDYIFRGYGEYFIRLLYLAHRKRYKILEVPVFYILRRHGQSKSSFFSMLVEYTKCVLDLRFRNKIKLELSITNG